MRTTKNCIRGILAVAGGFLVHLTLGTVYSFGNMTPYITSYIRQRSSPVDLTYSLSLWVFALELGTQGMSMFLGGLLEKKIGTRFTVLLGGWCMSAGVLLSHLTIQKSFGLFLLTYGIMFGFGVGLAYAPPLNCAMRWLPGRKGLANGIVVAGFGGGAFIFDQVQTAYLNPDNLPANTTYNGDKDERYFAEVDVLNNVPKCFLLLGGIYACIQFVGSMLLFEPPSSTSGECIPFAFDGQSSDQEEEEKYEVDNVSGTMEPSHTPIEMIRERMFYILWFMFFLNGLNVMYISTFYKAFGETFISSDKFFAVVGAFAAVCNSGGRIMWGVFMDKFSFRTAMIILTLALAFLNFTYILTTKGHEVMYPIWVCLMFLVFSGNFVLFPTAIAKKFGPKYVSVNYGLLFTCQMAAGPVGVLLASQLKHIIHWFGLFCLTAGLSLASAVLAYFSKI